MTDYEKERLMLLSKYPENFEAICTAALRANRDIAPALIFSMTNRNVGYDKLCRIVFIPYSRKDFYGYQRKAYAIFKDIVAKGGYKS